ncbi:unnamed protein product [Diamesa hyperborea]
MFPFGSGATPNTQQYPGYPSPSAPPQVQSNPGYPAAPQQMPMPFGAGFIPQMYSSPPANNSYPNYQTSPSQYPPQAYPQANQQPQYPPQVSQPNQYQNYQMPASNPYPNAQYPQTSMPNYPQHNANPGYPQNPYHSQQAHNIYPNLNNSVPFSYTQQQQIPRSTSDYMRKGTPTVLPAQDFDAKADVAKLRKAMKGFGTDEDALIDVICRRNNPQRLEISRIFKNNYGKELIDDIKSETRGNFENLLVALLTPMLDFYCKEIKDALSGLGTDEDVLIEILCTLSNYEINAIKARYAKLYGQDLEQAIAGDTSGSFKRLLVALCTALRDESGVTDVEAAKADATELLRAGELKLGTDESVFNAILCSRNYEQLKLVFREYATITGHPFEQAIKNEFSGDIQDGLLAIYRCVNNKAEFFARQLHKSMAGLGTNDRQLIRLIVTRCEIDMTEIKAAFERIFTESLKSFIKGDSSGDYKHALYALIGENRS